MINFKVIKKSKLSRARLGILQTPHGVVQTPALVPVATQAVVKTLTSDQVVATGSQLLIANTYHLAIRPGASTVKKQGGLHKFMHWPKPLMTDSGGFQVFSLGFGRELGTNKVITNQVKTRIKSGQQPKNLVISDDGVEFRSHVDGRKLFLGPRQSIRLQEQLGADIIYAFDECPPPQASRTYTQEAVGRTHRWAKVCLQTKRSNQALYGIVQGGRFRDLRILSARFMAGLDFNGYGVGGEFGQHKINMSRMLNWVTDELPPAKPRHLLGIGHLSDIPLLIKAGIDTFDCIVPTHYARHGTAFTSQGQLDMYKQIHKNIRQPLDTKCSCPVCSQYSRSYIYHLLKSHELTGLSLLTFHNLYFFNATVAGWRKLIKQGKL